MLKTAYDFLSALRQNIVGHTSYRAIHAHGVFAIGVRVGRWCAICAKWGTGAGLRAGCALTEYAQNDPTQKSEKPCYIRGLPLVLYGLPNHLLLRHCPQPHPYPVAVEAFFPCMSNPGDSSGRTQTAWYLMRESGSRLGLRFFLWLLKAFGYRTALVAAYVVSFYFIVVASGVRRRCMEFHQRALGHCSWFMAYRTLVNFSVTILDRAFIQMGHASHFAFTIHGEDIIQRLKESRDKGAIILGSHLGSVEAGSRLSKRLGISVGMLMFEQRSSMLYKELERLNPDLKRSIIEMKTDSIGYILEVRERYQKGGFIGILGDRTWMTGSTLRTPFLGVEKAFPLGAYQIASVLKSPIVFMVIVKQGTGDYHCYVEQLATEEESEGKTRARFSEEVLKRYVSRLEEYCRRFPTHWFNFYDFWNE